LTGDLGLAFGGAKGGKIVLSDQVRRRRFIASASSGR
jgi:hypothetical protein